MFDLKSQWLFLYQTNDPCTYLFHTTEALISHSEITHNSILHYTNYQVNWYKWYVWYKTYIFQNSNRITSQNITTPIPCVPHDDVIKWKHFPRYCLFVMGIQRSSVNSPHRIQWRGVLTFPSVCAWTNGWANDLRSADDLRRHRAHYDATVLIFPVLHSWKSCQSMVMFHTFWFNYCRESTRELIPHAIEREMDSTKNIWLQ